VAERESSGDAPPTVSRKGLIAGLACLLLAVEAAAAFIILFNLPSSILLYSRGVSSNQVQLVAILLFLPLFLASAWLLLPRFIRPVRWRWVSVPASMLSGALVILVLAIWAGLGLVSTLTAGRALHALVSPDGRHTLIIQNDSFLLLGQHTVYEKVGAVVYEERGEITTDNGYDPFSLNRYALKWDADAVTITYFDYHRYMTQKIPLNSKT